MKVYAFILFLLVIIFSPSAQSQTLFTYGNKSVTTAEFLRAYHKNNTNQQATPASYKEYLNLYTKYKLKVQAAYDQHLDTLPALKAELSNFRNQVIDGYLNDDAAILQLTDQAFERAQKDIAVGHIYIPFTTQNANDTLAAFRKASEAYKEIVGGKSFESTALTYSADPTVKENYGSIGFITVFSLPYIFENILYSLPVGGVHPPVKGKTGYHIFKNISERKSQGTVSVSQILIGVQPNADANQKALAKAKADSVYQLVISGVPFAQAALNNSTDNTSFQNGGQLPEFGTGVYQTAFEKEAFSLIRPGDISKPFATSYGYHILKLNESKKTPATKDSLTFYNALKQKVQSDARMELARKAQMQKILKMTGYKRMPLNNKELYVFADSAYHNKKLPVFKTLHTGTVIFTLNQQQVKAGDWAKYLYAVRNVNELSMGKTYEDLFQQYAENVALENYKTHLENYNEAFKYQMQEFKEGNLLFESMQRNVWDKAAMDTAGLKKYYEAHRQEYWWQPGVSGILFTVLDSTQTAGFLKNIKESNINNWRIIVEQYNGLVQADSGRFEYSQLPVKENILPGAGNFSTPVNSTSENGSNILFVTQKHPNKVLRSFDDARGFILNDYQIMLEEKWIQQLSKKYPLKINEAAFNNLPLK